MDDNRTQSAAVQQEQAEGNMFRSYNYVGTKETLAYLFNDFSNSFNISGYNERYIWDVVKVDFGIAAIVNIFTGIWDVFNDIIRTQCESMLADEKGEFLADFHSPAFSGERVMEGVAASEVKTAVALVDAKGCVVRKARGETLATDGVAPGCYILVAALRAGSLEIARTRTAVEVQPAPDWAK